MKKKKPTNPNTRVYIAIGAGAIIIGTVILFSYSLDQSKILGQRFGDNLAQIQADLRNDSNNFESKLSFYEKGNITKQEMLVYSDKQIASLNNIMSRYDDLKPPQSFAQSLELFRLSTQSELESDKLIKEWIEAGDNSTKLKSDQLLIQAFQYETSALDAFSKAKGAS